MQHDQIGKLLSATTQLGLTEALALLTKEMEELYARNLAVLHQEIDKAKAQNRLLETQRNTLRDFLVKLQSSQLAINIKPEYCLPLIHASFVGDINDLLDGVVKRRKEKPNYSKFTGLSLFNLCIVNIMYKSGLLEELGVASTSRALSFLGQSLFVNEFWLKNGWNLPVGEENAVGNSRAITEAYFNLVNQIFISSGYDDAEKFVSSTIDPMTLFRELRQPILEGDPKTLLQEYIQFTGATAPTYLYRSDPNAPDHEPIFTASVRVPSIGLVEAAHHSKKGAALRAAELAVTKLRNGAQTRRTFSNFLAKKAEQGREFRKESASTAPGGISALADRIQTLLSLDVDKLKLFEALLSPDLAKGEYRNFRTNETLAFMGSKLIEFVVREFFHNEGAGKFHPTLLDTLAGQLAVNQSQVGVFNQRPDHGTARLRDTVQAIMYAIYLNNPNEFLVGLRRYIAKSNELGSLVQVVDKPAWIMELEQYNPNFSYTLALQEYTQAADRSIPEYSDVIDRSMPHDPTHSSVVSWGGHSARGIGSRVNWARNIAAYGLLRELRKLSLKPEADQ
jgi:dsRNA-specific ribonuclease